MSQSPKTSAATPEVDQTAEPTPVKRAPVLITQQEVMFSTAAAIPTRRLSAPRRLIDAIRGFGAALHRPPARRHYPMDTGYLEHARMAREMDRL